MSTAAGQIVLDTDLDAVEQGSSQRPVCRVVANATQSVADATTTAMTFLQEDIDTHGMHSTSVNTSRLTPTVPGIYRFYTSVIFAGRVDWTSTQAFIRKNGSTQLAPADKKANSVNAQAVSMATEAWVDMNGTTDYVESCVFLDNTANTATLSVQSTQQSCVLMGELIRGPA
jgi:hypothetical protein